MGHGSDSYWVLGTNREYIRQCPATVCQSITGLGGDVVTIPLRAGMYDWGCFHFVAIVMLGNFCSRPARDVGLIRGAIANRSVHPLLRIYGRGIFNQIADIGSGLLKRVSTHRR